MRKLREAAWSEVEALFQGKGWQAVANAKGWADRYGCPHEDYSRLPVVLESWSDEQIRDALRRMTEREPRMSVDVVGDVNNAQIAPRIDGLPLVAIRFGSRVGLLDGKHRAHKWAQVPGQYAVLVLESSCTG